LGGEDVRETDRRAKVSHPTDCLAAAIDWLNDEVRRTPFGRLSIGVQMHGGQISKIFKSIEESTLASNVAGERLSNGRSE
jgi:hypothetical protein